MPLATISRRKFLGTLSNPASDQDPIDPLFEKYSRKTLGPRVFDNTLVNNFRHGAEDAEEGMLARVGNITSGLAPYTGSFGKREAIYLLQRVGFGYKKSDADTLAALGNANAAIDAVLNINPTLPPPPVNWYQNVFADENSVPYGADVTENFFTGSTIGQNTNNYRVDGTRRWLFQQACNQDATIREKMILFWFHFIPTDFSSVSQSANGFINTNSARVLYKYVQYFRQNVFGNFKTIIKDISVQPAMMYYLNNQANTAAAPDENFARELMELFTLGKDPLSQYTQADVVSAAQVLTGWRVQNLNTATPATNFVLSLHKTGNKTFSSFFNNTVIPNGGASELDALHDLIFTKTRVISEYICRRLYRFFIYYDIDANIEANVIVPLAQTFVANNWNILPVLKQLFKSQHFFDLANRGCYIKSPIDVVVGSLRHFNLNYNVAVPTNHDAQYRMTGVFQDGYMRPMEQRFGEVPNVSGWNAYYQAPAYHEYWINTNTIQKRYVWINALFNGFSRTYNGLVTTVKIDPIAYVQQFPASIISNPNLLVAECITHLLPVDLSVAQQATIKLQTLLYQQTTDGYWSTAWNNYITAPTVSNTTIVRDRLKNLLFTIVNLAEYQLM